ncbi:MAG: hypothetical protein KJS98_00880 [Nitrospirae bacterium]|nr:hypothetical protein [Nitrospirota bacterium]
MSTTDNLSFQPKQIDAVGIRPGEGAGIRLSKAIIQRTTALRAYNSYAGGRDWMEKLSTAYVVALATRSADELLIRDIQSHIPEEPPIFCRKCRETTIGVNVIRALLFPRLKELRKHANDLIHHLDDPKKQGVDKLYIQGVFEYCYHLFQENADALYGAIPTVGFEYTMCRQCREREAHGRRGNAT